MNPYHVVLADPPWNYKDKLTMSETPRGSASNYNTMSVQDVCDLHDTDEQVNGFDVAEDALLFLWVTNTFLLNGVGSQVCKAWGFEPKQIVTWVKGRFNSNKSEFTFHIGLGHLTRGCTEHMIVATRGQPSWLRKNASIKNVILAPREQHSSKPVEAYELIERLSYGPYLELFAREKRDGWTSWGDEI